MIIQNAKKRLQFLLCLWVDEPEFFFALEKIIQRLAVVIGISKVIPGCADPVHDHLCHIFTRHLRPHDHMLPIKRIVDPVLKMMLVPALVMEERRKELEKELEEAVRKARVGGLTAKEIRESFEIIMEDEIC